MISRLLILFVLCFLLNTTAFAAVPEAIKTELTKIYPEAKFRFDDLMQVKDRLWLVFMPKAKVQYPEPPISLVLKTENEDFLFSNGWIYTPIKDHTIKSLDFYPEAIQKQFILDQVSQTFLIPKKFTLPRDLAMTIGRLPLELSNVELATDRELLFKQRLEADKQKVINFAVFSNKTHSLDLLELNDQAFIKAGTQSMNGSSIDEIKTKKLIKENFTYISKIKKHKNDVYFSDFHKSKIYKLIQPKQVMPDATKPLEKFEDKKEYSLEEYLDLKNFEIKASLVDFAFSNDDSVFYVLTSSPSQLLVFSTRTKQLMKTMVIPGASDELTVLSRNASEPDKVFFRSRSANKVFVLNSFDYSISSEIDLNKLDSKFLFIPHSFAIYPDQILLGCEAISKNYKDGLKSGGKILVLDVITGGLNKIIDLDFVPYKLLKNDDKTAYIVGYSPDTYYSKLAKLDTQTYDLKVNDLGADFPAVKSLVISNTGDFILVPSSQTQLLGIIDTSSFSLVKKLSIEKPINMIIDL